MKKIKFVLAILAVVTMTSCHKDSISADDLAGVWKTTWDDIVDFDIDDIDVEEVIYFMCDSTSNDNGEFIQTFSGTVNYDDMDYEDELDYSVTISGTWRIKGNEVLLKYDMNKMVSEIEESSVKRKISSEVEKGVNRFFREMFLDMNSDKEAMTDVEIDGDTMTCEINHGVFGREATYYRVDVNQISNIDHSPRQHYVEEQYVEEYVEEGDAPSDDEYDWDD